MQKLIVALCLGAGAAYVAPAAPKAAPALAATKDEVVALAEANPDFLGKAIGFWDPLGALDTNFWGLGNEGTIGYLRHAEIKHGRVAMAAFVGFLVNYQGISFPTALTMSGEKFSSLGTGAPLAAWDNLSDKGKWSILGFIGLLEVLGEAEKPHYMRGGKSGTHDLVWYFGSKYISGKSEEAKLSSRTAEINNGRLAMIGIMGFSAAATIPGSVPLLGADQVAQGWTIGA
mmetsp:Transcript_20879/g.62288  ORF Transcript_20879/g.62288 Transcript_20879/m.62288 type:complete len:230 (+) Transcript_20879:69-758(+)